MGREWSGSALVWARAQHPLGLMANTEDLVEFLSAKEKQMSEAKEAAEQTAVDLVAEYLDLKEEIAMLEAQASTKREEIAEALGASMSPVGMKWTWVGLAEAQICKGRHSEKLDRAILARAGVDGDLLDKATVKSDGAPSLRISRAGEASPEEGL